MSKEELCGKIRQFLREGIMFLQIQMAEAQMGEEALLLIMVGPFMQIAGSHLLENAAKPFRRWEAVLRACVIWPSETEHLLCLKKVVASLLANSSSWSVVSSRLLQPPPHCSVIGSFWSLHFHPALCCQKYSPDSVIPLLKSLQWLLAVALGSDPQSSPQSCFSQALSRPPDYVFLLLHWHHPQTSLATPHAWNCCPEDLCNISSLTILKILLKSHLFRNGFSTTS